MNNNIDFRFDDIYNPMNKMIGNMEKCRDIEEESNSTHSFCESICNYFLRVCCCCCFFLSE